MAECGSRNSFCHVGPQVIGLSNKHLSPLNHLAGLQILLFHLPQTLQKLEEGEADIQVTFREFVLNCKHCKHTRGVEQNVPALVRQSHRGGQKTQGEGCACD